MYTIYYIHSVVNTYIHVLRTYVDDYIIFFFFFAISYEKHITDLTAQVRLYFREKKMQIPTRIY